MNLSLALCAVAWLVVSGTQPVIPDVPALLRQFEKAYRSCKTLRATFLERYLDNGKLVRSESGIAYFARPGKMRWEYESPEVNLYVVDGKWAWFYVPADHTVIRTRAKESSDARTPLALLAGEMRVSRLCKSVQADTASRPSDPRGVVLRCNLRGGEDSPKPSANAGSNAVSAQRDYALFELNRQTGELLRALVVDDGGVQVEFRFTNWEFGPSVEDAKFHFQVPKGVAIVDGDLTGSADGSGQKQAR